MVLCPTYKLRENRGGGEREREKEKKKIRKKKKVCGWNMYIIPRDIMRIKNN